MIVTLRRPVRVLLVLQAHYLVDLALHQVMHDPQADAHAQRASLAAPTSSPSLPESLQGAATPTPCTVVTTCGIPSSWRFPPVLPDLLTPRTLPTGADEAGGPPLKVLRGFGQPPVPEAVALRGCRYETVAPDLLDRVGFSDHALERFVGRAGIATPAVAVSSRSFATVDSRKGSSRPIGQGGRGPTTRRICISGSASGCC